MRCFLTSVRPSSVRCPSRGRISKTSNTDPFTAGHYYRSWLILLLHWDSPPPYAASEQRSETVVSASVVNRVRPSEPVVNTYRPLVVLWRESRRGGGPASYHSDDILVSSVSTSTISVWNVEGLATVGLCNWLRLVTDTLCALAE